MPFETAPKAGTADIVPPPFTPPTIGNGRSVACIGRAYSHGSRGLLESLVAADQELLAAPAALKSENRRCARRFAHRRRAQARRPRKGASRLPSNIRGTWRENGSRWHVRLRRFLPILDPASARRGGRRPPAMLSGTSDPSCSRHAARRTRGVDVERLAEMHQFSRPRARPPVGFQTVSLRRAQPQGQYAALLLDRRRRSRCLLFLCLRRRNARRRCPARHDDRSRRRRGRVSRMVRQQAAETERGPHVSIRRAGQPVQADEPRSPAVALWRHSQ